MDVVSKSQKYFKEQSEFFSFIKGFTSILKQHLSTKKVSKSVELLDLKFDHFAIYTFDKMLKERVIECPMLRSSLNKMYDTLEQIKSVSVVKFLPPKSSFSESDIESCRQTVMSKILEVDSIAKLRTIKSKQSLSNYVQHICDCFVSFNHASEVQVQIIKKLNGKDFVQSSSFTFSFLK